MSSSTRWCFTVNNPGEWRPAYDVVAMKFLVYQLERGAVGTLHIQGYVRFASPKKLQAAKNALVRTDAHMEIAQGNEGQCVDYCTKADTRVAGPWTFGTVKRDAGRKGSRSDLQAVAEAAQNPRVSLRELAMEFPAQMIKYSAQIDRYRQLVAPPVPLERNIFVHVLWGPTNTGKTHRIRHGIPAAELYVISAHGRDPFGQYAGQSSIVLEEFESADWKINEIKTLLDKWACPLDARYANKDAKWTNVFITSNSDPMTWYGMWQPADLAAFRRRLTRITHVLSQEQEIELLPPPQDPPAAPAAPAQTPPQAAPAAASPPPPQAMMDEDQPCQRKTVSPGTAAQAASTPTLPRTPTAAPLSAPAADGTGADLVLKPLPVARSTSVNLQDYFEIPDD